MNLFLSWSGKKSHLAAKAFETCLPLIFNGLNIYLSTSMEKGVKWEKALDEGLETAELGILCVTRDNFAAPWLMYEAGVLYKTVGKGFVTPFLLDIGPSELSGPLTQFQATVFEEADLGKLMFRVNQRLPQELRIEESIVQNRFKMTYDTLLERLLTDALNAQDDAKSVTQKLWELCKGNQALLRDVLFELQTRCP